MICILGGVKVSTSIPRVPYFFLATMATAILALCAMDNVRSEALGMGAPRLSLRMAPLSMLRIFEAV